MEEEDDGGGGDIPEWVVTFGDMMSLLLTFFIMLVSLSEMKQDEKFLAQVEAMQREFGYDMSQASMTPGDARPRNSRMAKLATSGRAKRRDTMKGGAKVVAASGENKRVQSVRPGTRTGIGAAIHFNNKNAELTDQARQTIDELIKLMNGKPQKIDVRGHTSRIPITGGGSQWSLAFDRADAVRQYMFSKDVIEERIRISVAGPTEPLTIGGTEKETARNDRVEIFMLNETISDSIGEPGELEKQLLEK